MRIKLDENLPGRLAGELAKLGHDVDTVLGEGLRGRKDSTIWEAAQQGERFLITQDLDFSDARAFVPGTHCGILLVRLRQPSRRRLIERVRTLLESEDVADWGGAFAVATESKVRVRRATST